MFVQASATAATGTAQYLCHEQLVATASSSSHDFPHLRRLLLWQGLRSLQPRIQAWLGRAAAAADALMVQAVTSQAAPGANREVAQWDPDNKLALTVPFPEDTSLVVWLDKTLPQVLHPQPPMCRWTREDMVLVCNLASELMLHSLPLPVFKVLTSQQQHTSPDA